LGSNALPADEVHESVSHRGDRVSSSIATGFAYRYTDAHGTRITRLTFDGRNAEDETHASLDPRSACSAGQPRDREELAD
jgi:hypothetical protein